MRWRRAALIAPGDRLAAAPFSQPANRGDGMEKEAVTLNDRQRAVLAADRIRDYWTRLGFEVKVEVHNDGSIRSDMIAGKPAAKEQ